MEYEYRVGALNCKGICDVERIGNIVVITQRENQLTPITNAIEHIADDLARKYKIHKKKLIVFSRIPKFNNFTRVKFDVKWGKLCNPVWENVTDEYIQSFLDGTKN